MRWLPGTSIFTSVAAISAGERTVSTVAPRPDLLGPGRSFGERLARWAADARADEAAIGRTREAFLRRVAGEATTLAGVLLDVAERGTAVLVVTAAGRRRRGAVEVVGTDFVALRTDAALVLLPLAAVAAVHVEDAAVAGDRGESPVDVDLAAALALLAEDRPNVLVVTAAEGITGELSWCGTDVLAVGSAYVPIAAITEVTAG
jgi:hypothetical protein